MEGPALWRRWRQIACGLCVALGVGAGQAAATQDEAGGLYTFFSLAAAAGGDTLTTVRWADGSTHDVRSGRGLHIASGLDLHLPEVGLALQLSLGYAVDGTQFRSSEVRFERWPAELMIYGLPARTLRVGLGMRYSFGAQLVHDTRATSTVQGQPVQFSARPGAVAEIELRVDRKFSVGLRVVSEQYRMPGGQRADGSHAAVRFTQFY